MSGLENDVLVAKNVNFDYTSNPPHSGIVIADGQLLIGSTANPNISMVANTLTAGTGMTITNGPGTITIATTASLTDLHTARYIVSSAGTNGTGANYTTIAAAIAGAVSSGVNSTVFIQPGTYTENFTLPDNINLAAYTCDALTPNVTIVGNITCTSAGSRSISGIRLQTNSAALLTVSGTLATVVNLNNCYLNCTNNTGITFSTSSSSAQINITNCKGDLGTTGITLYSHSSAGVLDIRHTKITNSGGSSTASTMSAGSTNLFYLIALFPFTTSSTGTLTAEYCYINTAAQNATALTIGGSGTQQALHCDFLSGTASAVSISSTCNLELCNINSSNANVVTGAGTLNYALLTFSGSSSTINTSTQTPQQVGPKIYTNGGISFDGGTNILANYATGSWTPNVQIGGSSTGITYSSQSGLYTRIGNVVFFSALIQLTSKGGLSGAVTISNLPVQTGASGANQAIAVGSYGVVSTTSGTTIGMQFANNSTQGNFLQSSATSGAAAALLQGSVIADTTLFKFNGFYIVG